MGFAINNSPNNTSYSSSVVNGQLVPNFTQRGMFPSQAAAPYWYGNGSKPATLAGFSPLMGGMSPASGITGTGIGGGSLDISNPWSPTESPLPWAIGFLIVGFLGLRHIHWRG
jgi:hypothetical protein